MTKRQVKFRFNELRSIKERQEDRKYSLRDIADKCKEIDISLGITEDPIRISIPKSGPNKGKRMEVDQRGISIATLTKISNNDSKSIHLSTINLLCEFFECEIEEIMIRE